MRVSREQAAANRDRIIDAAASLFRAKGFGGIGVADIMKAAALTHGGFYGHFASKDDLVAQASRRTMASAASALLRASRVAQARGNSPFFGVSSTSAGRSASGSMPAWLMSASRRGEPEAR